MDQQMTTLFSAAKEVHSSNTRLFERFNALTIYDKHLDCKEGTEKVQKEVTDLKQRLSVLHDGRNLHEETIQTVKDQLKEIKEKVDTIAENLAIDNVVSEPEVVSKLKSVTKKTKVNKTRLQNNSYTDGSAYMHVSAGSNTQQRDQSRLQSNQTSHDKHVRVLEGADGGICDEILTTRTPEVVKQSVERVFGDEQYWRFIAHQAMEQGKRKFRDLKGVHTVICLDISESMANGNAWRQALCFLNDYLTGLEEMAALHGLTNEHVALVTFGHETKLQQPFTNNFKNIKRVVNTLRLGGPSALFGGLFLSVAAAGSSEHQVERTLTGVIVRSKFVIITDGFPTENGLKQGPDVADPSKMDETKASILQLFDEFHMDIFCIPVGNASDMEFLQMMAGMSSGRLLDYMSGKRLSRDYYLHTKLVDPLGLFGSEPFVHGDETDISAQDKEDMKNIQKRNKDLVESSQATHSDQYRESNSKTLPVIGSRVRRGPDWHWHEQDSHGPGTVVGHGKTDAHMWVTWDENGSTNVYEYGKGTYTVLVVDELRKLKPGQTMAVGCIVKPGKDWKETDKVYNKGVVIEITGDDKAVVRWENGDRNTYTFNGRDGQKIELCASGFAPFNTDGNTLGYASSASSDIPSTRITKTKNKNI